MPAICLEPPNGIKKAPRVLVPESRVTPELQSPERQKVAEVTEKILWDLTAIDGVLEQWENIKVIEQELIDTAEDTSEFTYRPVPPNRSFTVRMRCQFKGRGEPRKYPLDDE
ncbi:hypothetical protein PN499_14200 [Kamptonema animale CS-326]|jgi:hypothetical protein|uniref:hypothetical protein n=1 Tax=Kamptonema animale TaxID=92934 RepID=UPI0023313CF3|nr:hypothetical protein [Kamptonema animale]MDB9512340.1 hypothetical protein [Kamptonema animale CS-326]